MERLWCLAAGYLCGCFLTGELAARLRTGGSARSLGSGNPGTANIAARLGRRWGAAVLAGDLAKTALACFACRRAFPALGSLAVLWAGLGAVIGHDLPFWNRFRGGKGVAVTCASLVFFSPAWGTAACLAGLALVLATGYLALGALAIPAAFLLPAFLTRGPEAGLLSTAFAALMLWRNLPSLGRIAAGTEPRSGLKRL